MWENKNWRACTAPLKVNPDKQTSVTRTTENSLLGATSWTERSQRSLFIFGPWSGLAALHSAEASVNEAKLLQPHIFPNLLPSTPQYWLPAHCSTSASVSVLQLWWSTLAFHREQDLDAQRLQGDVLCFLFLQCEPSFIHIEQGSRIIEAI